jgi:hypothetical protein
MAEQDQRPCSVCGDSYPTSHYNSRQTKCRKCLAIARKTWNSRTPENNRRALLKQRYGISVEELNQLHFEQNGQCAICDVEISTTIGYTAGKTHRCVVDHNALTGEVRGLLCDRCNLLLGHAGENTDRLHSAIIYLAQRGTYHGTKEVSDEEAHQDAEEDRQSHG